METDNIKFESLVRVVTNEFMEKFPMESEGLYEQFSKSKPTDTNFILPRIAFLHARMAGFLKPHLMIIISTEGVKKPVNKNNIDSVDFIHVFFFLVSPEKADRQHLRLLTKIADIVEQDNFVENMLNRQNEKEVKEYLLHYERFFSLELIVGTPAEELIGKKLRDIELPTDVLIVMINRDNHVHTPRGNTVLLEGDRLTIIGETESINELMKRY